MSIIKTLSWYLLTGFLLYGVEIILCVLYALINCNQLNFDKMASITANNTKEIKRNNLLVVVLKTIIFWPIVIPISLVNIRNSFCECRITK